MPPAPGGAGRWFASHQDVAAAGSDTGQDKAGRPDPARRAYKNAAVRPPGQVGRRRGSGATASGSLTRTDSAATTVMCRRSPPGGRAGLPVCPTGGMLAGCSVAQWRWDESSTNGSG